MPKGTEQFKSDRKKAKLTLKEKRQRKKEKKAKAHQEVHIYEENIQ